MTQSPGEAALIESALAAIGMVLARMDVVQPLSFSVEAPSPQLAAHALSAAPFAVQAVQPVPPLPPDRAAEYRAIQCCLASASALLGVSQTLIRQPASPTPTERARQWNEVISQTKTAGRAAYQAALMLADKHAD